jgi:predicted AAA+ superfamily ATPase
VGIDQVNDLWLRGAFPRSFLASSLDASIDWRRAFIRTFLERDIPQLGIRIPSTTLYRFWKMLAHYHGQIWNGAELARAFGVSHGTVRRYLDVLSGALVIRQLTPWHENISKRQVKSPKVYLGDSGLLHSLFNIDSKEHLEEHPKVGASWEGFVIRELIHRLGARPEECFFWGTYSGAELDLLIVRGHRRYGFEVKRTTAPRMTQSFRAARDSLGLTRMDIIHAGEHSFPLTEGSAAVAFERLFEDVDPLD